ncbi:hypothetical protein [Caudoviricetes sp.]|nr:hypothetical protein [Caudoviricetes sp.]
MQLLKNRRENDLPSLRLKNLNKGKSKCLLQ